MQTHGTGYLSLMGQADCLKWDLETTSYASRGWGCGAVFNDKWLQLKRYTSVCECSITHKELIPIMLAAALWGRNGEQKL